MASTTSAASAAAFIKAQDLAVAEQHFKMATTALLLWHYVLTVEKEFAFFWRRRFSGVCALFLANRYLILVVIVNQSPWWNVRCSHRWQCQTGIYLQFTFQYLQYLVWAVFSFLRVYALQMRWGWAIFVLILSLGHVAYGVWTTVGEEIVFSVEGGCHSRRTRPPQLDKRLAITARAALVLAEIIVMAVTWTKMRYRHHRGDVIHVRQRALTLSSVFYENGRVFFVLIIVLHAAYLVNWMVPISPATTNPVLLYSVQFSPLLIEPTIGILVNHFLIELQEAANRRAHQLADTHSCTAPSDMQESTGSGSVSLLQFARADVDEWLQPASDDVPPASECAGAQDGGPSAQ